MFGFGSLVIFCWLAGLGIFGFLWGVRVRVKCALGRDDIQIRINVYFMVFWYEVLLFKVSNPGEISDWLQKMDILLRIVWVCPVGFLCVCVYFFFSTVCLFSMLQIIIDCS